VSIVSETSISVRHNFETAHRLFQTPGKCENIHGHSFWCDLELVGQVGKTGMLADLDFGDVKKKFRSFLDENFDHKTLLNKEDPWAGDIYFPTTSGIMGEDPDGPHRLPGLFPTEGDPTTENIAYWIATWALQAFPWAVEHVLVKVQETAVNAATATLSR
jgi:6-pyruvoyltetrahydropterin/6-carboxytetrahydropterin synthase